MKAIALVLLLLGLAGPALGQQAQPVIGYLGAESAEAFASRVDAFRKGLGEMGFVEGRNVSIQYRWAQGNNARLPELAAQLVKQGVSVLVAPGSAPAALAAKKATSTIPVVFEMGLDPVKIGLVDTMNRPGGNVTGVTSMNAQLASKRLQLLREIVPGAKAIALLVNPTNARNAETAIADAQAVARASAVTLLVVKATSEPELADAFRYLAGQRAAGLVIANDPFFVHRSRELAALALRDAIPTVHQSPDFVAAGGLLSYGANPADSHRVAGLYAGRILKGEKPADLPVQQIANLDLFVNLKTARALGLAVPPSVRLRATGTVD